MESRINQRNTLNEPNFLWNAGGASTPTSQKLVQTFSLKGFHLWNPYSNLGYFQSTFGKNFPESVPGK